MKVAFVSGPIDYSVCLANALAKECTLDFTYGEAYIRSLDTTVLELLDDQIRKVPVNGLRYGDPKNFFSYRQLAKRISSYDIIHVQGSNIWLSLTRHLSRRVPIIATIHDPKPHSGLRRSRHLIQDLGQRLIVAQSSAYIVHGDRMKQDLIEQYRVDPTRVRVIPHGEFSFYRRWQHRTCSGAPVSAAAKKRILFFGVVRKNKGLEYLIKAEPLISAIYPHYTICIAGKFSNEPDNNIDYYRQLMTDPDRYELHNRFIANDEVAELVEGSDLVVLPYVTATQSGVLPLAFGFGKPVVATDTGSISEVLRSGDTGLLVPPCDAQSLAGAIAQLLNNDALRLSMGEKAAAMASGPLSWDTIGRQTIELYRTVLKR